MRNPRWANYVLPFSKELAVIPTSPQLPDTYTLMSSAYRRQDINKLYIDVNITTFKCSQAQSTCSFLFKTPPVKMEVEGIIYMYIYYEVELVISRENSRLHPAYM